MIKKPGASQDAILGVKEKLLEIREIILIVLKVIDEELSLGQIFVVACEDEIGLGSVNPMGASVGLGTMKGQWTVNGKKKAHEHCGLSLSFGGPK